MKFYLSLHLFYFENTFRTGDTMDILIQFVFKRLDNTLGTFKTIYLSKGKHFQAALFNTVSSYFYFITIKNMTKSDSNAMMLALCFAVFLGTYIPGLIIKRTERDSLFIFDVTADTMEKGIAFADNVRVNNIPIRTCTVYGANMVKTLSCTIYCPTRHESSLVESLLQEGFKWNVSVPKATP